MRAKSASLKCLIAALKRGLNSTAGLDTLEFPRKGFEPRGFAVGVQFLVHPHGKFVQLPAVRAIFVLGIIFGVNFYGTERNNRTVNHYADIFAAQGSLEPRTKILPGCSNG